ncbi:MAG: hypothetical protein JNL67_07490 [Planctomycetaceae bacterium]|nr:hypothetical protein [Planctomycetaceae bacterium]
MPNYHSKQEDQDCRRAIEVARQGENLHWELSGLLEKIQRQELWRSVGSQSFKQFVQEHLRLAESTSRQLLKVRRMCDEHSIPPEKLAECGWSKMAEIAKHVTSANKDVLMQEVAELSLTQLREKYRAPVRSEKTTEKKNSQVVLSEEVNQALRHAARFTRCDDLQTNLEFVAKQFQLLMPRSPEIQFSRN